MSSQPQPNPYIVDISTDFGTFHLRINKISFPDSFDNEITMKMGVKDFCAFFSIPMYKKEPIKLSYARASSDRFQCTLDNKEIKGETTYKMMCLAFTIIREITDQTYIEFDDMSHFDCVLPNGEKKDVTLAPFSFLFNGQTWYEQRFGAVLVNIAKRNAYMNMKCRRTNPEYKPATYEFGNNKSLQTMLQPHFEATRTWAEFFERIAKEYGKNKCHIVYPCVSDVLEKHIFKNNFEFSGDKWIMNIDNMSKISYTIKSVYSDGRQMGGGDDFDVPWYDFTRTIYPEAYIKDLDYTIFKPSDRKHTTRRRTRKNK